MRRRFNESVKDELVKILDELNINKDDVKITEKNGETTVEYNGDGFVLEKGDKVSDYKKDIIAILKKQKKESLRRKDEFLKGLIGRVNMTDADWKKLLPELKSVQPKLSWKLSGSIITGYGVTSKEENVSVRIGETANKIYITLKIGSKKDKVDGLRPGDVAKALAKMMKGVRVIDPSADNEVVTLAQADQSRIDARKYRKS